MKGTIFLHSLVFQVDVSLCSLCFNCIVWIVKYKRCSLHVFCVSSAIQTVKTVPSISIYNYILSNSWNHRFIIVAQVEVGGRIANPTNSDGDFFTPTILTGVTRAMQIWTEEVFGPVMVIIPFNDDAEAISMANDSPFGLGSNVFSGSNSHANAIASQLEVQSSW